MAKNYYNGRIDRLVGDGTQLQIDLADAPGGTIAIITTRKGFCFGVTYASGTTLTREKITNDWKQDRRDFRPIDYSTMQYLD